MDRLSKNQDIPRPFVFRPPDDTRTRFDKGESLTFGLVLIGRAFEFIPYFVLSFRELAEGGLGLNRARCTLEQVEEVDLSEGLDASEPNLNSRHPDESASSPNEGASGPSESASDSDESTRDVESINGPGAGGVRLKLVYSVNDQLFRAATGIDSRDWVAARTKGLGLLPTDHRLLPTAYCPLPTALTIRFLTPTFIRAGGQVIQRPDFQHVFKRLRDRINALNTFFGEGPLEADFRGLGERAERVRTVSSQFEWVERARTSAKTKQRHELSGFMGEATYEGELVEFLPWLVLGELVHVGRHTAWGNGRFEVTVPPPHV